MTKWIFLCLIGAGANASTFVGNGGGAGDVELSVTRKQIEETFTAVTRHKEDGVLSLCECNRAYENRSVCEPLKALSEPQKKFCAAAMIEHAPELIRIAPTFSVRWTREPIEVKYRGGLRAVDAVSNRADASVTINLERFLEMKPFERVFLLTHELLHLSEKAHEDAGPVGPFKGEEGGLQFLNAMGSAAAVLQSDLPSEIRKYRARLSRSKSWKPWWFEANAGGASPEAKGTFAVDNLTRAQVGARYALGKFTFGLSYRGLAGDKKALGSIQVEQKMDIVSAGLGYRFFIVSDPYSFWGQTHFLVQAMIDRAHAKIQLHDAFSSSEETQDVWGGNLAVNYYLPLFWGFWGYVGTAYEVVPYKFDTVNVESKDGYLSQYLGAAYAF